MNVVVINIYRHTTPFNHPNQEANLVLLELDLLPAEAAVVENWDVHIRCIQAHKRGPQNYHVHPAGSRLQRTHRLIVFAVKDNFCL